MELSPFFSTYIVFFPLCLSFLPLSLRPSFPSSPQLLSCVLLCHAEQMRLGSAAVAGLLGSEHLTWMQTKATEFPSSFWVHWGLITKSSCCSEHFWSMKGLAEARQSSCLWGTPDSPSNVPFSLQEWVPSMTPPTARGSVELGEPREGRVFDPLHGVQALTTHLDPKE